MQDRMARPTEDHLHMLRIYLHSYDNDNSQLDVRFNKRNTTEELIQMILERIGMPSDPEKGRRYELCEVMGTPDGQTWKERALDGSEYPVAVALLWPKHDENRKNSGAGNYRFVFREKASRSESIVSQGSTIDSFLKKFLNEPSDKDYPDLCMLPELTEETLLENLKDRFNEGNIYTYIGPILVAVNPYTLFPIYNPKYVKLYQNCHSSQLPPHIFAIGSIAICEFTKQSAAAYLGFCKVFQPGSANDSER